MEERGHKDSTSFRPNSRLARPNTDSNFVVTDEEVKVALNRLQARVEGERIGALWQSDPVVHKDEGPGDGDEAIHDELGAVVRLQLGQTGLAMADKAVLVAGTESAPVNASKTTSGGKAKVPHRRMWRRVAWGAVAAVALIGVVATPLGSKAMAAAMQTLYFHNLVGVSQSDINQIQQALQTSGVQRIDLKRYGSVQVTGGNGGAQQNLSLAQASKLAGYPIKILPGFDAKRDSLSYTPGYGMVFRLNVSAINGLIATLGGKIQFPVSVNEQPISVQVPQQIYENVGQPEMSLSILRIPTVQVPDSVNMNQVRQALMDLPLLPSDIRQSLATASNWQDNLYVAEGGTVTNMTVNGYSAVLQSLPGGQARTIMWLEKGTVYRLSGPQFTFPTAASIIAEAKELSQ